MRSLHNAPASTTSAVAFVGSSVFCSLLGRVIVTRFFFDYPIVIQLLQSATTLFVIEVLRVANVWKVSPYSFERGRHAFGPSVLLCISQWLTVCSFEGIGLPVFDSVKRLTPLFIAGALAIFSKSRPDKRQLAAVTLVSFISFATVNLENTLDRFSFFYGLIASLCQAIAYVQFEQLSANFQASELLYLHSFNSLLIYLVADIVQDEVRDAFMYLMTSAHPAFTFSFVVLLIAAIPLQYTTFLSIQHNGALNTQIISNVRASIQIFFAYSFSVYLFYGTTFGVINYLGLLLILPAAYYYTRTITTESPTQKGAWSTLA